MIEIKRINQLDESDMARLITGYQSPGRYRITKLENEDRVEIIMEMTANPYTKSWEITDDDCTLYARVVSEGNSLAAFDGKLMVGLALAELRRWNRTLWIWEFHVLESYRRLGIGRQMMDTLEVVGRQLNARTMLVETQNTNLPAIRFYHSVGFTVEGIDLSYYTNHDVDDFEVAIFMKRRIES
jgi:ribosomal protein S18 acetylase RimI-like enzyme